LPAVERIAQKHTSLNVTPEQYAVVGENLLASIDELLHPGQEVLDAWGRAYGVLADIFIQREGQIYRDSENTHGGWRGLREFRIVEKQPRSESICSFVFEPVDGGPVADFKPGQYLAVHIHDKGLQHQQIRQYSLTTSPNGGSYRIAVKREDQGVVSRFLHEQAEVGDVVHLTPPHGDFFMDIDPTTPVALISAGVGLTPILSMLNTLAANEHRADIVWLHATDTGSTHAFTEEIGAIAERMPNLARHVWYRVPAADDVAGRDYDIAGQMTLDACAGTLDNPEMHYYFCGPVGFMQSIGSQLVSMGVGADRIHYEVFGPHKVI
jgi:nitric oxide dioxygenase